MSTYIDPIWLQKQIEEDELRLINFKAGHYYISRQAEIYSMNMAQPRRIMPIPKLTGEQIIVLYTPGITAYDVSSLVLSTYSPSHLDSHNVPCYRDADPTNCSLSNLFWGNELDALTWRKEAMKKTSQNTSVTAQQDVLEDSEESIVIEQVPSMVKASKLLSALIDMIISTTQRMMSHHEYDDETQFLLRMTEMRFKHALGKEYVPLDNLRSVFELEAPDPKVSVMMKRFHERFEKVVL
ncbi:hypothetical protein [Alteromonas sp. BZK5]|jgi:hypothetical protein|uniref:hypothetical protein n=1 Tax=Alteromonas sp. BZK5 TaxID=1904459 RepID=UPI001653A7F9|nr:hypothetical protein [Alteromonas sp. BZK5]MBC6987501.1 hypothetical protein [Alteromonas sp. BZK5]